MKTKIDLTYSESNDQLFNRRTIDEVKNALEFFQNSISHEELKSNLIAFSDMKNGDELLIRYLYHRGISILIIIKLQILLFGGTMKEANLKVTETTLNL